MGQRVVLNNDVVMSRSDRSIVSIKGRAIERSKGDGPLVSHYALKQIVANHKLSIPHSQRSKTGIMKFLKDYLCYGTVLKEKIVKEITKGIL